VDSQTVSDVVVEKKYVSAAVPDPASNSPSRKDKEITAIFASGFSWIELLNATADVYNGVRSPS
jgi:hypothetical protein